MEHFGALSALDSHVTGVLHTTDDMRSLLGERALLARCLEVEAALAAAQADLGLIPPEAATGVANIAVDDLDLDMLAQRIATVGYPVVGLVEQIVALVPDNLGEFAHWGATTQDIMDTALVLQVKAAIDRISVDLESLIHALVDLARTHRDTPMAGRSQMQQAVPITFGYRVIGWLEPLLRHVERLNELRPRVQVVQLGGAVGSLASMTPNGLDIRKNMADKLGLGVPSTSWHASRDRIVETVMWAAQVSASLAKIGTDVALSAQTELGELGEGGAPGGGSSSTMPQKRNPIQSQQLIRSARLTRTYVDLALDGAVADHDRATAGWSLEWHAVAPALAVAGGAVDTAVRLIKNLQVHPAAMAENLDRTGGAIMAEAVMMVLARTHGRQAAHDQVAELVRHASEANISFAAVVAAEAPTAVAALDPMKYLGHITEQIDAVLAQAAALCG